MKHESMISDLKSFYDKYKEAPKQGGLRPGEKKLASWIHHRKDTKKNGKIDSYLENEINNTFPWWSW